MPKKKKIKIKVILPEGMKARGTNLLVPDSISMGQLYHIIRGRVKDLQPDESLFYFINNHLTALNETVGEINDKFGKNDMLEIKVIKESCFGCLDKIIKSSVEVKEEETPKRRKSWEDSTLSPSKEDIKRLCEKFEAENPDMIIVHSPRGGTEFRTLMRLG